MIKSEEAIVMGIKKMKFKYGLIVITVLLSMLHVLLLREKEYLNTDLKDIYEVSQVTSQLKKGDVYGERFWSGKLPYLCIKIRTMLSKTQFNEDEVLIIKLRKEDDEKILLEQAIKLNSFRNNELSRYIYFDNIRLENDVYYRIEFETNVEKGKPSLAFIRTENAGDSKSNAIINGVVQDYDLGMIIYE